MLFSTLGGIALILLSVFDVFPLVFELTHRRSIILPFTGHLRLFLSYVLRSALYFRLLSLDGWMLSMKDIIVCEWDIFSNWLLSWRQLALPWQWYRHPATLLIYQGILMGTKHKSAAAVCEWVIAVLPSLGIANFSLSLTFTFSRLCTIFFLLSRRARGIENDITWKINRCRIYRTKWCLRELGSKLQGAKIWKRCVQFNIIMRIDVIQRTINLRDRSGRVFVASD
jgi:hypothetical protein